MSTIDQRIVNHSSSPRHRLWSSGYKTDGALYNHSVALVAARQVAAKANSKFLSTKVQFLNSSESSIIASKPPLVALLSNSGNSSTPTWSVSGVGFSANEDVYDVLTCTKYTADGNGALTVTGTGGQPQVCSTFV